VSYELTRELLEAWQKSSPAADVNHQAKAQAATDFAQYLLVHLSEGASPAAAALQSHLDNHDTTEN
jgi:hypothetical protein